MVWILKINAQFIFDYVKGYQILFLEKYIAPKKLENWLF